MQTIPPTQFTQSTAIESLQPEPTTIDYQISQSASSNQPIDAYIYKATLPQVMTLSKELFVERLQNMNLMKLHQNKAIPDWSPQTKNSEYIPPTPINPEPSDRVTRSKLIESIVISETEDEDEEERLSDVDIVDGDGHQSKITIETAGGRCT